MELQLNHCYQGDCRDVMCFLGEQGGQVQTIITSPLYFNLRDYGVAGQIGMEKTVEHYIEVLVEVLRHARRLLADDGTRWLGAELNPHYIALAQSRLSPNRSKQT